jgi:PAS domain S-box-containing protein
MQKKPNLSPKAAELRHRAEERLQEQHTESGYARTKADTLRLVHELQVHQIELEMQNEALQKSRDEVEAGLEKYSDLYDFAPVGYLSLDRAGTIQEANLTAASLFGLERSRLLKRRFGTHLSTADLPVFNAFLEKVFASKVKEFCEVKLIRDGKHPLVLRIEAAAAAAGQECRAAVSDITERKRAEEDRLILSKLESTGILAGGIAHDFNNLLTVILLNLEMARTIISPGEELTRRLEEAKKAASLARGLTQQLISFAKGGEPVRKWTSLSGLIEESARLALSGSRVRSAFSLVEDLWPVEVDAGQIAQVIRNLVLNAREAMAEGGTISVRAENVVLGSHENPSLPPGDYMQVTIADEGAGIAKEVLPQIFDPYFSTKQRGDQKGMGLGLTICHTVIQKHGGAIAVESKEGVGTAFHIYLPASRMSIGKRIASVPKALPRPGRILVMDDEEGVRDIVEMTLQQMGHEVVLVEDGQIAVEVYGRARRLGHPFDAVILDLTVRGGMGGMEAFQALLQMDPNVKAIVMSGYANDPAILEPERCGIKCALVKPFDFQELRETVSRVMGPDAEVGDQRSLVNV